MKTVNCNGVEIELTEDRRRRIIQSMIETQDKLYKELNYSEDLQHKGMIEFYRNHIAKLAGMLQ